MDAFFGFPGDFLNLFILSELFKYFHMEIRYYVYLLSGIISSSLQLKLSTNDKYYFEILSYSVTMSPISQLLARKISFFFASGTALPLIPYNSNPYSYCRTKSVINIIHSHIIIIFLNDASLTDLFFTADLCFCHLFWSSKTLLIVITLAFRFGRLQVLQSRGFREFLFFMPLYVS